MPHYYDDAHFQVLKNSAKLGSWREQTPAAWAKVVGIDDLSPRVADTVITRSFLKDASAQDAISDRDLLWGILAWGGMRRDAARRLKENEALWVRAVHRLRHDGLTRGESYTLCSALANQFKAGGIGPAYFTKLIFFANPRHDGYIMDQWTSRSLNLLVRGAPVVKMRTQDHVDPRNDATVYETFCRIVEDLSKKLGFDNAEVMEQCLFSTGGAKPDDWRRYVKGNGSAA